MESSFLGLESFLMGVPAFIRGRERLNVVVASENRIPHCTNSTTTLMRDDLAVNVEVGCYRGHMDVDGIDALQPVLERVGRRVGSGAGAVDLLCCYAGVATTTAVVEFVHGFHLRNPDGMCVVVACDCDRERRRKLLEGILAWGIVGAVVVVEECGGGGTLRQIIDAIVAAWVSRRAPAEAESA